MVNGYTQKEGKDFIDAYSLVTTVTNIRATLSLATSHGLLVH
jgi:hypothetical protein